MCGVIHVHEADKKVRVELRRWRVGEERKKKDGYADVE